MRLLAVLLLACAAWPALSLAQGEPQEPARPAETRNGPRPEHENRPAAGSFTVTWQAPAELRALFEKFLPPTKAEEGQRATSALRSWIRDMRKRVPDIAAAEGYFSPTIDVQVDDARDHATVTVTPGPRAVVDTVQLNFEDDLALDDPQREKRREALREAFAMKPGQPFRSADWEAAKTKIEELLTDHDYAAGTISASRAEVDAEAAKARLSLTLASGPRFTFGDVTIDGLKRYSEAVVRRVVDLKHGEPYSRDRLDELQRRIQAGPWFATVTAEVERNPEHPLLVPVIVTVTERSVIEVGVSAGYGTDDGFRGEASYRDRDLFGRAFDLQSSVRLSQKQQFGYADVYLPSGLWSSRSSGNIPYQDSVGVLAEHNTLQNNNYNRIGVAGYRHWRLDQYEVQAGLSYQVQRSFPTGGDVTIKRALAPIVFTTWRFVDNVFDPRKGGVLNMQLAAGSKSLASGEDFVKTYAQYQHWFPIGDIDTVLLRAEIGRTFAQSKDPIPDDYLFRAGGSRSNRGYAYQSLGPKEGDAVVGGRFLATGTLEYTHWLNDKWGGAVFTDVGTASDTPAQWEALKSYGVGARYKTPAGPFALDVAYAARDHKFRLAFSVSVAF